MTFRALVGALWYLQSRSVVNSIKARLRRLRQPKYLIGAIFGTLYLASVFGRWILGGMLFRANRPPAAAQSVAEAADAENLGAAVLFGFLLSGWFFAKDRAALAFTDAEVMNLFPAPLPRSLLLAYRILRGQTAILFTTLMLLVFTGRIALGFGAILPALGWWVVLSTVSLHGLGASFAVQRLTERGLASGWRRLLTLAVPGTAAVVLWLWYLSLPQPPTLEADDTASQFILRWQHFASEVFHSGPAPWLLWPFRLVVRPLFATGFLDGLGRFAPALALLALQAVWVLRSAVSFEEATLEQSRRTAERVAGMRSGRGRIRRPSRSAEPYALSPIGARWVALWWCGLIESHETPRRWFLIAGVTLAGVIGVRQLVTDESVPLALGMIATGLCGLMVLIGGQTAAQRFARTLRELDLYKAFPIAGWEIFLGTILGGITSSLLIEWLLLAAAAALLAGQAMGPLTAIGSPTVVLGSLGLLAPVATLFLALPVSLGFVLFPAWFTAARENPGVEMMGQRMLLGILQLLILLVAAVPVAVTAGPVYFLGDWLLGTTPAVLASAATAALVLAAECAVGIWWIGRRFDGLNAADES